MDAVEAIADMARRVGRNGPEITYAGEKLETILYRSAEGLALCEVSLDEVVEQARQGHRHGTCLGEEEPCDCPE